MTHNDDSQTDLENIMNKDTSITIQLEDTQYGIFWRVFNEKHITIAQKTTDGDDMNDALAQAIAAIPATYSNETTVNVVANDEDLYCEPLSSLRASTTLASSFYEYQNIRWYDDGRQQCMTCEAIGLNDVPVHTPTCGDVKLVRIYGRQASRQSEEYIDTCTPAEFDEYKLAFGPSWTWRTEVA